ncbi:MAG: 2-oxoglutarate dehydrogenase complex dihydrolipoyllysine-residue succinyltransferase [Planctomycetia bacterium]|jgi:2-oxoglutarate dehydrogenase E2 component (dihydrolipoamide succinyltransferase)|nr:2-oxoglutarate dehydrogenase complex dihydrolipoyllysine-residue succinyltransferase [Planctomycetia bacterium]
MAIELKVPEVGESITEVMIGTWKKGVGEQVVADESVVEIESDKATVELPAPSAGVISQILKQAGEQATVGEVIGYLDTVGAAGPPPAAPAASPSQAPQPQSVDVRRREGSTMIGSVQPAASGAGPVMPAAARVLGEAGVPPQSVAGSGPGGRVTKSDAMAAVAGSAQPVAPAPPATTPGSAAPPATAPALSGTTALAAEATAERAERAVLISPIRRRIAERLVEAQHEAALLTTFNEVDMSAVMAVRKKFKDSFSDRHGVKLGFMSFFVRAAVEALRAVPQVNAEFRDPHIVYRDYCDIGIAVGGGKGLVVPVLRNAEQMNFAEIEQAIGEFARRAAENKLKLEELQGGTFTISNGGVYGSMMSTPIINPPQSGILGLHAIQERPVAVDGQVVIRPMMYLALTYDHRLVDGREAVTFLKRVKDTIEDPTRLMLEC